MAAARRNQPSGRTIDRIEATGAAIDVVAVDGLFPALQKAADVR
jgi:hypothetical protein